jgi:hypothetical protein
MKNTIPRLSLLISVIILFVTNCEDINSDNIVSPEDSAAAIVLVANANASLLPLMEQLFAADPDSAQPVLNSLDLSEAHGFYVEASDLDWRNQEAHFGLGLTSLLILSQNTLMNDIFGSSTKVFAPFDEGGAQSNPVGYGFGLPISVPRTKGMLARYFELPLSIARLQFESLNAFNNYQTQVNDTFLPMVEAGIASLDSIDNDPEFIFTLSTDLQINLADILAMESSLFGLQGFFKGLAAYNYTLDTSDPSAIITGLTTGSTFGTLSGEGSALLSEAHESALASLNLAEQVLDMVLAETAELNHLFVQYTQSSAPQIQTSLDALTASLTSATNIEYAYADIRGSYDVVRTANMDISQFYLNPVEDVKALLPPYTMSTITAYNYNQVTLYEAINYEETQVLLAGLNNTPISVNIEYSEMESDTTATVTLGFLTFNLLTANQGDLPAAIWDLWAEFLTVVGDYSDELHNFPEISFHWSGFITTGASLVIDGDIAIDYLERTGSYAAPDILWSASSYEDWVTGWTNPTVNGLFPDFTGENLADLLGLDWE